eukprot:SAG31_NODE_1510_length_8062_cov_4.204194_2_plen_242_part_00
MILLARTHLLQLCLVGLFALLDQLFLVVIEVVKPRPILRPAVVALSVYLCRIVRLPEPAEEVYHRDLGWVVDHLHGLRVSSLTTAALVVRRVGREPRGVADCRAVDASTWQAPEALLAAPKAAIRHDDLLHVSWPRPLHRGAQHEVLLGHLHGLGAPRKRALTRFFERRTCPHLAACQAAVGRAAAACYATIISRIGGRRDAGGVRTGRGTGWVLIRGTGWVLINNLVRSVGLANLARYGL